MLTYTMSKNGYQARIGPCFGGFIRLAIIRLCRELEQEIPPETLDESTTVDQLRDLNLDLLIERQFRRQAARRIEHMKAIERQTEIERALPPTVAAKVAELRDRAAGMRLSAQHADRSDTMRQDLDAASHLDAEAARLIAEHTGLAA